MTKAMGQNGAIGVNKVQTPKQDEPDDQTLYRCIVAAHQRGEIAIDVDARSLAHPHCPLSARVYSTQVFYAIVVVVGLSLWLFGYQIAIGVAAAALLLYWSVGRRLVHRKMREVICAQITGNFEVWRKMWRFGAITLSRESPNGLVHCRAPEESWRAFARGCRDTVVSRAELGGI